MVRRAAPPSLERFADQRLDAVVAGEDMKAKLSQEAQ